MKKSYLIFGFEKSGQSAFNLIYNKNRRQYSRRFTIYNNITGLKDWGPQAR